jgi:DNA-cytosine methyltransferase
MLQNIMSKKGFNVLSLFDGISCAREALQRAGIPVSTYYASETDRYAIEISQKNWPEIIQTGNVKNVGKQILVSNGFFILPKIDLLIGGSPCQDLSIAKKDRKGLDGERSGLFWEYVRILKEVKPKYFILENVNSMPKEARELISETLGVQPVMINASLVSAQNRKRLFWCGKLSSKNGNYEQVHITQPGDRGIMLKHILEQKVDDSFIVKDKSNTVRTSGRGSGVDDKHNWDTIRIGQIGKGGQGERIYSLDGKSVGLSALGGGRGAKTGLYAVALTETRTEEAKKKRAAHMKKIGKDYSPRRDKQLVPRRDGKSNTITTGITKESLVIVQRGRGKNKGGVHTEKSPTLTGKSFEHNNTVHTDHIDTEFSGQIRKLTPVECERLQGLPDNYTGGVSNTQRYKALGNAFNVDVVAHILCFIKKNR